MFLYNITLQRATGITHAIQGNFSGSKHQEVVVSRGKLLDVLRPDPNTGKVVTLLSIEVFGVIRSLMSFRLTGGAKGMPIKCNVESGDNIFALSFPMIVICKAESMNFDLFEYLIILRF
jgi:splicing factor 3B subunit 3